MSLCLFQHLSFLPSNLLYLITHFMSPLVIWWSEYYLQFKLDSCSLTFYLSMYAFANVSTFTKFSLCTDQALNYRQISFTILRSYFCPRHVIVAYYKLIHSDVSYLHVGYSHRFHPILFSLPPCYRKNITKEINSLRNL